MKANDKTTMPSNLEYWTATDIAECLSYQKYLTKSESAELYRKLWSVLENASNPTPQGGDGSDGTVEEPAGRLDLANDDKAGHWWDSLLTPIERAAIIQANDDEGDMSDCLIGVRYDDDDRDMTGQDSCDGSTPDADMPTHEY